MEFYEALITWTPSLASVLLIVAGVIPVLVKLSNYLKSLKDDKTVQDLISRLNVQSFKIEELTRCNKLLLDKITKIQGYADHAIEGKKNDKDL